MGYREQRDKDERGPDRQVDPATNPGPRGNQDIDPRRMDLRREDLDRLGAN
jgi:hypothetical protein